MDDLELRRWTPEDAAQKKPSQTRIVMIVAGAAAVVLAVIAITASLLGHPASKTPVVAATQSSSVSLRPVTTTPAKAIAAADTARPASAAVSTAKAPMRAKPAPVRAKAKPVVKPKKAVVAKKKPAKAAPKPAPKKKAAPTLDLDALSKYGAKAPKGH